MKPRGLQVVLACVLMGVAVAAWAKVFSDHDPQVDFDAYRTYAWMPREGSAETQLPEHLQLRLRRVSEEVLATKGFEPAPAPPQADLLLTYYLGLNNELRIDYVGYGPTTPWGYGYWPGFNYGFTDVREYTKGTLVLDIVDAETRRLVWTGTLKTTVQSANPPGNRVEKAVKKLLKDFPPKKKK